MNSVSAEGEVDNWPNGDAWLYIELLSWSANETVEWDNNNGIPDPHFEICIEADGINIDCINTPTWDDQMELVNPWNYSIDIPDYSNILNITIECRDNDAINDDECDMNSELDEWKLFAEYNWSLTPTKGVIGNGDGDENGTWKNAASEWRLTIDSDYDGDGIMDASDDCPNTSVGESVDASGCSSTQRDSDDDGVVDATDNCPNTPVVESVDASGCSSSQRDSDSDGIVDSRDDCPNTTPGESVDVSGCSSSQLDSDRDGIADSRDECPNTATGASVYSTGCLRVEEDSRSDSNSESSSGATSSAGEFAIGCLFWIGVIVYFTYYRKKKTPPHRVRTPPSRQQHVPIQRQPSQQEIQAQQLAHQKQIETQHFQHQLAEKTYQTLQLQKQLAEQSRSATEMNAMQAELSQLQESKAALEKELEDSSKSTTVVQNITYNIQDSAISGDITANLKPKDEGSDNS
jgi:hypothetical protein